MYLQGELEERDFDGRQKLQLSGAVSSFATDKCVIFLVLDSGLASSHSFESERSGYEPECCS